MANKKPIGVAFADPKFESVEADVATLGAVSVDSVESTGDVAVSNDVASLAFYNVAITANSTLSVLPKGSVATTSNTTGAGKIFVSDGAKWQEPT